MQIESINDLVRVIDAAALSYVDEVPGRQPAINAYIRLQCVMSALNLFYGPVNGADIKENGFYPEASVLHIAIHDDCYTESKLCEYTDDRVLHVDMMLQAGMTDAEVQAATTARLEKYGPPIAKIVPPNDEHHGYDAVVEIPSWKAWLALLEKIDDRLIFTVIKIVPIVSPD